MFSAPRPIRRTENTPCCALSACLQQSKTCPRRARPGWQSFNQNRRTTSWCQKQKRAPAPVVQPTYHLLNSFLGVNRHIVHCLPRVRAARNAKPKSEVVVPQQLALVVMALDHSKVRDLQGTNAKLQPAVQQTGFKKKSRQERSESAMPALRHGALSRLAASDRSGGLTACEPF